MADLTEAEREQIASDLEYELDRRLVGIGVDLDTEEAKRSRRAYRIAVERDGKIAARLSLGEDPLGALAERIAREAGPAGEGRGLTREKADAIRAKVRAEEEARRGTSYRERLGIV